MSYIQAVGVVTPCRDNKRVNLLKHRQESHNIPIAPVKKVERKIAEDEDSRAFIPNEFCRESSQYRRIYTAKTECLPSISSGSILRIGISPVKMPLIYNENVIINSPDPISKFSGKVIVGQSSRSSTCFRSPEIKSNRDVLPLIHGNNVTIHSPDPQSKLHISHGIEKLAVAVNFATSNLDDILSNKFQHHSPDSVVDAPFADDPRDLQLYNKIAVAPKSRRPENPKLYSRRLIVARLSS